MALTENLTSLGMEELRKIAGDVGVDNPGQYRSKQDLVDAIGATQATVPASAGATPPATTATADVAPEDEAAAALAEFRATGHVPNGWVYSGSFPERMRRRPAAEE